MKQFSVHCSAIFSAFLLAAFTFAVINGMHFNAETYKVPRLFVGVVYLLTYVGVIAGARLFFKLPLHDKRTYVILAIATVIASVNLLTNNERLSAAAITLLFCCYAFYDTFMSAYRKHYMYT